MIEGPPTFVDEAFTTSRNLLNTAAEVVTSPAQKVYDSLNQDGGSIDMLKRQAFRMLRLREPKMRGFRGRRLQHA